jgi:hypothetical protein
MYLGSRLSRSHIPSLGLAWSRYHIPSLDLAVMLHLLLSQSCAYGSGSTSLYLEEKDLVLALGVTVASLWVRDGGVGFQSQVRVGLKI